MKAPAAKNGKKKRIDWTALHAALAAHAAGPAAVSEGVRADRLLAERTRALAISADVAPKTILRALMLRVGRERYALPLPAAREVIGLDRPTALPGVRGITLGLISWRGDFAAVFDLAQLLGAPRSVDPRRAVVLGGGEPRLALAVDAVEQVDELDLARLQPAAPLAPRQAALFQGAMPDAVLVFDAASLAERLKSELQAA